MPVKAPWACKCGKRVASGQSCPCCAPARKAAYDAMRPRARARGYDSKWDKERETYLRAHPHCVRCAKQGIKAKATVINHIIPHRGDKRLFWSRANWQPVCAPCHNGPIQSAEKRSALPSADMGRGEVKTSKLSQGPAWEKSSQQTRIKDFLEEPV